MKSVSSLSVALLLIGPWSLPQAVANPPDPPPKSATVPPDVDYKVIIWYRRDQPLATFKYQIYNVRKGEYTPAVETWLELMRTKFRGYNVVVRNVDLTREEGQTEALKVGSVIKRELMAVAGLEGVFIGPGMLGGPSRSPGPGFGPISAPQVTSRPTAIGPRPARALELNPPSSGFPFPVPYPRPHP
jgi:hypothetical protein